MQQEFLRYQPSGPHCSLSWGFHKLDEIGNNANIGIRSFTMENKKIQYQNVTPSGNRTTGLGFQVQHAPFYTNWALATWEIFKHLFMHHLIFGL